MGRSLQGAGRSGVRWEGRGGRAVARWLCASALAVAVLLATSASGQDAPGTQEAEKTQEPEKAAPVAVAIPVAEIAGRVEIASRVVEQLAADAGNDERIDAIRKEFTETASLAADLQRETGNVTRTYASKGALVDLDREWRALAEDLASWRKTLTRDAASFDASLAQLDDMSEVWTKTRDAAREAAAPGSVLEQVGAAQQAIADARTKLRRARRAILDLQARVARQEALVTSERAKIAERLEGLRGRLFEREAPALWSMRGREDWTPAWGELRESFERDARRMRSFLKRQTDAIGAHLVFLLTTLSLSFWAHRWAARWPPDDPRRGESDVVFERWVSTGVLVALLGTPWFHTTPPGVLQSAIGLAVLLPVLRLLPRLVDAALRPALIALAVLYATDFVRGFLEPDPRVERIVLAVETAAAAAVLVFLMRPGRLAHLTPGTHIPRGVRFAMRAGLAVLLVSVFANVAGYVSLARLLGEGTLSSAYLAIALYGGLRVLRTGVRAALASRRPRSLRMVQRFETLLRDRTRSVLTLGALAGWIWFSLDLFGLRAPVLSIGGTLLGASLRFGTIEISVGSLLGFAATVVAALLVSRLVRFVLEVEIFPRFHTPRGVPRAVTTTVHYGLLGFGLMLAFAAAGVDWSRFSLLAGALGVGVGFGLQNIVNNFVSGLILLYERPIQIGDSIEVGTIFGDVRRIGVRSSTVRTWQGAEVIIPNAMLISDRVTNWTLSDRYRRIEIKVGVAYGTDPTRVIALLEGVTEGQAGLLAQPRPQALFLGFGDSSLDFELRVWTPAFENYLVVQSALTVAIETALREAGITIPFPQRDLHLVSASEEVRGALGGRGEEGRGEEGRGRPEESA